jgi:hypothetical protein
VTHPLRSFLVPAAAAATAFALGVWWGGRAAPPEGSTTEGARVDVAGGPGARGDDARRADRGERRSGAVASSDEVAPPGQAPAVREGEAPLDAELARRIRKANTSHGPSPPPPQWNLFDTAALAHALRTLEPAMAGESLQIVQELRRRKAVGSVGPDTSAQLLAQGFRQAAGESITLWTDEQLDALLVRSDESLGVAASQLESLVNFAVVALRERKRDLRPVAELLADHQDVHVRRAGVLALTSVEPPEVERLLAVVRDDSEPSVRFYAAAALCDAAHKGTVPPERLAVVVETMLQDEHPPVRSWGAHAALRGGAAVTPRVAVLVTDPVAAHDRADECVAIALRAGLEARLRATWDPADLHPALVGALDRLLFQDPAAARDVAPGLVAWAVPTWAGERDQLRDFLALALRADADRAVRDAALDRRMHWRTRLDAVTVLLDRQAPGAPQLLHDLVVAAGEDPLLRIDLIRGALEGNLHDAGREAWRRAVRYVAEHETDRWVRGEARKHFSDE